MPEHFADHAVNRVQVLVAVVVEVAELRRPAPPGGIHAGARGAVLELAVRPPHLQRVGVDLGAPGRGRSVRRQHRRPGRVHLRPRRIRLHVRGEQLEAPVVVDVALRERHRVVAGLPERRGSQPAPIPSEINVVGHFVVVADQDVTLPVGVQIDQGDRQSHRVAGQPQVPERQVAGLKPVALGARAKVLVVVHAAQPRAGAGGGVGHAAQEPFAALDLVKLLVVGTAHQVEIAVIVQVRPGHGVNREAGGKVAVLDRGEGAGGAVPAQPQRLPVVASRHQIEEAVAIHVHGVDRPGLLRGKRHAREAQTRAAVPEHGERRGKAGQGNVDCAVTVEVGQRHPGAVAVERLRGMVGARRVRELVAHEAAGTRGRLAEGCNAHRGAHHAGCGGAGCGGAGSVIRLRGLRAG